MSQLKQHFEDVEYEALVCPVTAVEVVFPDVVAAGYGSFLRLCQLREYPPETDDVITVVPAIKNRVLWQSRVDDFSSVFVHALICCAVVYSVRCFFQNHVNLS
eukprot:m.153193 g.153193  ORF g.153193 m.153193 type:complete len:103 (+) comp17909_c0_seq1:367-675(+)